jgi:hypothetical protein
MGGIRLPHQQGFILAATLWTLAIMFIVVGIFHTYVQQKLQVGIQAKANLQHQLDRESTKQTMLYLLASSRMTLAGVTFQQAGAEARNEDGLISNRPVGDELFLDDSVYIGINDSLFNVQDGNGLISLNAANPADLIALVEKYETELVARTQLMSRLKDYIDANSLISLAGAEVDDYRRQRLMPPTNDLLRSEVELTRVMGWQAWLNKHPEIDIQNWFSVGRDPTLNLNTMPKALLIEYFGMREELADKLVTERKTNPFLSVSDFVQRTNLLIDLNDLKYRFFPSNHYKLSIWNKWGGQAQVISLQLTPNGLYGPWLVNYEYSVQRVNDNNEPLALRQTRLFGHTMGSDR